jgi:hypothetical protein
VLNNLNNKKGSVMKLYLLLLFTIIFAFNIFPQNDLQTVLQKLSKDAATAYVGPTVSAFGADLNSGWVHRVPKAKFFGIDIELGFVAMGTFFSNNNKTFSTSGTFRFNRDQAAILVQGVNASQQVKDNLINQIIQQDINVGISGPTIVGAKSDSVKIAFNGATLTAGNQSYVLPGRSVTLPVTGYLENIPVFPLFAPQLTIGTFYGSSIAIRYVPAIKLSDKIGDFTYFGIGVQHNPAMWLPFPLPLEVSVGLFTQTMKLGTVFQSSATTFGIYGSKTFGPGALNVTPYAGLSYESSSSDVSYDFILDTPVPGVTSTQHMSFNLVGENSVRFMIGAAFKLAFISLNVDYNISNYNVASAGLGIIF